MFRQWLFKLRAGRTSWSKRNYVPECGTNSKHVVSLSGSCIQQYRYLCLFKYHSSQNASSLSVVPLEQVPEGVRSGALCFSKQTRRCTHLCIHSLDQLFTFIISKVDLAANWMTFHFLARIRFE